MPDVQLSLRLGNRITRCLQFFVLAQLLLDL